MIDSSLASAHYLVATDASLLTCMLLLSIQPRVLLVRLVSVDPQDTAVLLPVTHAQFVKLFRSKNIGPTGFRIRPTCECELGTPRRSPSNPTMRSLKRPGSSAFTFIISSRSSGPRIPRLSRGTILQLSRQSTLQLGH